MTNVALSYLPGVCKVNSPYAASKQSGQVEGRSAVGRFIDMDKVRFVAGFPEKIGGWEKEVDDAFFGVPRGLKDWRSNGQVIYLGIGTTNRLYYYAQNEVVNITPLRDIFDGILINPFATTINSNLVTVTHTAHGQQVGDYVILVASTVVGGLSIAGVYFIETVPDADHYTFRTVDLATSSVAAGGGSTAFQYYRITLTNPFATVSGSPIVTVSHFQHNAQVGDTVIIGGATAVGGLTLSGEYIIVSADISTYTINAGSNASSTATGGGTPNLEYEISVGLTDSAAAFGYGTGGYGEGGYGETGSAGNTGIQLLARVWYLANYGQQLLANPSGGTIYVWDPSIGGRAYPLFNAPSQVLGMFVTPERFVIALGVNGLAMQIAWPDQDDYTDWTSTPTNTANEGRTLQEGSYMVNGIAVRDGISMLFSNTTAYSFDYTGDNNVYASNVAGKQCGLVGPLAVCVVGGVVYWMSQSEFWSWNGSVQALGSDDIRDFVFQDINLEQSAKFVCNSIIAKKEVTFRYCSANSLENDRYVTHHIDQNCWSHGTLDRTSMIDKNLLTYPMATDPDGFLYKHEFGHDDDGSAMDSYVTFDPMDIADGNRSMDIFGFIPDFKRLTGDATITPLGRAYPTSADVAYGPYTIDDTASVPIIDFRLSGRLFGYKLEQNVLGGDWRLGVPLVDVQPAGARR